VEDNKADIRLIQEVLKNGSVPYEIITVRDGMDAMAYLRKEGQYTNDDKLPKEKKLSHFQLMRSAIKTVAQLLDEVMFIGKADTGKLHCELSENNLELFCRQLVKEAQISLGEENITIIFSSFSVSSETLFDESLLQHILGNLLSNAIKYSPANSTVRFDLIGQDKVIITAAKLSLSQWM
jgi:signal transduction histidine kinase